MDHFKHSAKDCPVLAKYRENYADLQRRYEEACQAQLELRDQVEMYAQALADESWRLHPAQPLPFN